MYKRQGLIGPRHEVGRYLSVAGVAVLCAVGLAFADNPQAVSYTHLRAHETVLDLVCRLLLEKTKTNKLTYQHAQYSRSDTTL